MRSWIDLTRDEKNEFIKEYNSKCGMFMSYPLQTFGGALTEILSILIGIVFWPLLIYMVASEIRFRRWLKVRNIFK